MTANLDYLAIIKIDHKLPMISKGIEPVAVVSVASVGSSKCNSCVLKVGTSFISKKYKRTHLNHVGKKARIRMSAQRTDT